jgi:CDP-diacylglycerol--glycerol-3-phosphate 3-phosphatidyltransferase
MNWPNSLTLARILLIPVLVALFFTPGRWTHLACAAVFGVAALTDWLDGYLARRLNQTSAFGAFLDPVADKLIVAATLVLLVQADPRPMLAVAACVIVGREITISALRERMAELGVRAKVAVATVGKLKTALQMAAIALMLLRLPWLGVDWYELGYWLLMAATVLTLWSMVVYLRAAWPAISPRAPAEGPIPPQTGDS